MTDNKNPTLCSCGAELNDRMWCGDPTCEAATPNASNMARPQHTEALHIDLATLGGEVEAVCFSAPENIEPHAIAEFMIDGEEPDDHGRVMCASVYRPIIEAMATLALAQIKISRWEDREETKARALAAEESVRTAPTCVRCGAKPAHHLDRPVYNQRERFGSPVELCGSCFAYGQGFPLRN